MDNARKRNKPRQAWNPHWILKLLYGAWSACLAVLKIAIGAAATVLLIGIVCAFVFIGILGTYLQDDILPEANYSLDNAGINQTSNVYYVDHDGNIQLLQRIHTSEDRQWAPLDEIPDDLIHAAVAIEDKRFYEHQGVDWITTVKACANMFFGSGDTFGGSTITQQLIKNLTGEKSVTVQRKVMEIFRAQQFEKKYDKNTIMEWYLNSIYFGRGKYGVKSAAAEYFGKELQSLTTAECASLISITNNPSIYGPYSSTFEWTYKDETREMTGAERNKIRQENTLWSMKEQGWLDEADYEAAINQELVFKKGIDLEDRWIKCGTASCGYQGTIGSLTHQGDRYYCPQCGNEITVAEDSSQEIYSWFVDTVIEDVAADLAARDGIDWNTINKETRNNYMLQIQLGGYHIFTTLDMDVQNAIDAVYTDLSQIPATKSTQQLQSGIVVIDNRTGDIVGMAGGVGEKVTHDAYNRATDAKLQTGSSQKPISVYAPAFEVGAITPATVVKDLPVSYENGVFPKNDNRKYSYSRTIFEGIEDSVNAVAVNTLRMIGYDYSFSFAKEKFGLSTLTDYYVNSAGKVLGDKGDSPLAMGALTVGATVRDMSAAYATFANNGVYREARTYTKVYDSLGNVVLDNTQDSRQILSEKTVTYMNYCLQNAVNNGTGGAASVAGQNVAGKTGTTSSNKDRWFCGFTGYYTAAVWCGYDQPEKIRMSGSNPAAQLFRKVMTPIHEGKSRVSLYSTSQMRSFSVCLDSGKLATDACRLDIRGLNRVNSAMAYSDDGPSETCDKHVLVDFCVTGGGVATEYCHLFENAKVEKKALVKMTPAEIEQIRAACGNGLSSVYEDDKYVYYVSNTGEALDWHGFSGRANSNISAPYVVCPVHTKQAWEAYQAAHATEPEEEPTPGEE
ncbi:MAG: transglycosylase domain-containing protein [Clostridiales bacterium]|nr:transglycosylase domain-containing protein [Clostridiales bacterium]MDD7386754.1 transglycosylase domain-containing protein [Bacillota bacterium]MDY6041939.1 transglycosylase domain-containing protein [Candidatus Faecousia sp.]